MITQDHRWKEEVCEVPRYDCRIFEQPLIDYSVLLEATLKIDIPNSP